MRPDTDSESGGLPPEPFRGATCPDRAGYAKAKRVLDFGLAGTMLAATMPLMLLAAAAIQVRSRGPVFYAQVREGLGGQRFTIWKLRTMYTDAPERLRHRLESDSAAAAEWRQNLCLRDDSRVVGRAGQFIRRYSIDELPQLWNVVIGDMSLVGPRPLEPEVADVLLDAESRCIRWQVRPGLSGLWQVSRTGKRDVTRTMRDLDLRYVAIRNLQLDLWIIRRTLRAIASGAGDY